MTPNRLIMRVAPAESATVPRRPGSGHWPADISKGENSLHHGTTEHCEQWPASRLPRQTRNPDPAWPWRETHRHGSGESLNRVNHY